MDNRQDSRAISDLAIITILFLTTLVLSSRFNWFEALVAWSQQSERFEVDEIVSGLMILALCLAGYSLRRWQELRREIRQRQGLEEELSKKAFHDALTGLPNRSLFVNRLEHSLARSARLGRSTAVLFMDLDRFKIVNDSYGHEVGDKVLVIATERIRSCLRPGDSVGRLGGDEFVVLLEAIEDLEDAVQVAERTAEKLAAPFEVDGYSLTLSASIGITISDPGHGRASTLLREADQAMYRAKEDGRARYEIYDRARSLQYEARIGLEPDLTTALENDDLEIQYQPSVDLQTGEIVGVEALLRWRHRVGALLTVEESLNAAGDSELVGSIENWTLAEVCRQSRQWPDVPITVALSARQFNHNLLVSDLARMLHEADVQPANILLEIAEEVVMNNPGRGVEFIGRLKDLGCGVVLGDFGGARSNLTDLHRLHLTGLKVQRRFATTVGTSPESRTVVSGAIALGATLNCWVSAEGLQTAEQAEAVRRLGCHRGQGPYLSPPVSNVEMSTLLGNGFINLSAAVDEGAPLDEEQGGDEPERAGDK